MPRWSRDGWTGLACMAASALLLIYIESQPFGHGRGFIQDAGFFPRVAMYLIGLGGAGLFLSALRGRRGSDAGNSGRKGAGRRDTGDGYKIVAILVLFTALLRPLGFLLAAPLALGAMAWLWGERHWPRLVAVAVLVPVVLYWGFKIGLQVPLPPVRVLGLPL